ncbi:MAG: pseudouridine synthase [Gammaproteobacteria bacterium]|nr:pseudouridine synthase [Gammaproteobacteria bacterium]
MPLEIIYQDEYLVAINKPGGLLSVPGLGAENQDSVVTRMLEINPEAKVVHRLDCLTSGIMLLALGIKMQRELSRQFHDRKISKQYVAVVRGAFDQQQVVLTVPASFDEVARELTLRAAVDAGLPHAVLLEEPLAAFYSWLARH